jgi:hypothetical protein
MQRGAAIKRLMTSVVALVLVSGAAHADDRPARKKKPAPAEVQSQYKLDLSTSLNASNAPAPPPGASTLTREDDSAVRFLGLKLSKPLGN